MKPANDWGFSLFAELIPLRTCKQCALEATDEEELEKFVKSSAHSTGRLNLCKRCSSKYMKDRRRREKERRKAFEIVE